MQSEDKVRTEDELEQMAKSILGKINLFAGGETWEKQQIVLRLMQALYQEQCPNKEVLKHLCYLNKSDFVVLGSLLECLTGVRMSDETEKSYRYLESRGKFYSESRLDNDLPF